MGIRTWFVLTARSLRASFLNPLVYVPNFLISLFFLFVYSAGVQAVTGLSGMEGVNYTAFILPVAMVSAAFGAASGAVETVLKDMNSRYFIRLMLASSSGRAVVLGPVVTGAVQFFIQSLLLMLIAAALGVRWISGIGGIALMMLMVICIGLAFTGFALYTALKTESHQCVNMATMIFFPLLFLSTTFVPIDLIESRWMYLAARVNPVTYLFDGIRYLLIPGMEREVLYYGLILSAASAVFTLTLAFRRADDLHLDR